MTKAGNSSLAEDFNEIVKKAQEQPGITELMQVYGNYDSLVKQMNVYLGNTKPKIIISTTNSSS
jgi:hypothetical protein